MVEPEGFLSRTQSIKGEPPNMPHTSIAGSLREFLHALRTGQKPWGECHDNLKTMAMVFAAIESAAAGRQVPVES